MELRVKDIRSIERAILIVSGATLVAGLNGAGKSTLLRTAAALVTGITVPDGMKKSELGALVRVGCADGQARLFNGDGPEPVASVTYPSGEYENRPGAIRASIFAAGLQHFDQLDGKEKADALQPYLGSQVTRDDFEAALRDEGFSDKAIEAAWEKICDPTTGWDGLLEKARDHGKKLKGKWEQVTAKKYGSKVGGDWVPAGWEEDLATAVEEDLAGAAADARALRDEALKNLGADEATITNLHAAVANNPGNEDVSTAQQALDRANADLLAAQAERTNLPATAVDEKRICSCPECGADVVVREQPAGHLPPFKLEKPTILKGEEKEVADKRIAQLDGTISRLRGVVNSCEASLQSLRDRRRAATAASETLAAKTGRDGSAEAVEAAKAAVAAAERRLGAFLSKSEADRHHRNIQQNQKLIDLLAPDGLRQRKMQRALAAFNDTILASLSSAAGWATVEIDPGLGLRYGGRPAALCSESEVYRARATLQAAFAQRDGSGLVIMDGADVLDRKGRQQLVAGLAPAIGMPVLIGMTFSERKLVPDLGAVGLGQSYWIENGMCSEVITQQKAAAE